MNSANQWRERATATVGLQPPVLIQHRALVSEYMRFTALPFMADRHSGAQDVDFTGKSAPSTRNLMRVDASLGAGSLLAGAPAQRKRLREVFHPERTDFGPGLTQEAPERFGYKAAAVIERTGLGKESLEAFDMVAKYVAPRTR